MDRRLFIVIAVVGFHVLGLWALQTGLLRRAVELVVPVEVLAELIELPQPQVTPAPPPPQPQPKLVQKPVTPPKPLPKQAPQPLAIADPTPSAAAPTGTTAPQPPAPPMLAPVVVAEPAPPAPPKIVLPSSDAAHLNNPRPPYPNLSHRLGETGKVVISVLVEIDGRPSQVLLSKSSGYNRLDQAALITVKNRWRFVPGTADGTPIPSWVVVSLQFELTE
ncbi:MAG: energy transducer TonB [Hydrogenophaga sp.]|uniref:energy transducer TonB n=1 Tax=Hydrogenophaga sp. TaxID=1904254 RepID=UPI0025BB7061|nr:energy transducer TonB [Hydrogenophaga sp.]MBT9553604.1 energy transducer TonB [Hydrogenophaga sp.]